MSLLFRIVYAAHANGTHHKLALDALQRLQSPHAEQWRRVFLKHVALYLEGSKDPDNKFKDFKNHVLHVRDNYWGGAPEKVQNWYGHAVTALKAGNWSEAVYAAGVLSHYYTDPIHPFHTGQTEAENNIHRAVEWSINRSYDTLKAQGEQAFGGLIVNVPAGDTWLRAMTLNGAEFSNKSYEKLIAHYDISRGVVDPPAGLDAVGRKVVAELLIYAAAGFARILDRALEESGQLPPEVSLTMDTVLAGVKIPAKALQKRLTNAADRDLVQRMYDELKATGTVDKTLPEDDRTVRDLHAAEVLAPQQVAAAEARKARLVQEVPQPVERPRPVAAAELPEPPAPVHGESAAVAPAAAEAGEPVVISDAVAVEALEQAVLAAGPVVAEMEGPLQIGEDEAPPADLVVADESEAADSIAAETIAEAAPIDAVAQESTEEAHVDPEPETEAEAEAETDPEAPAAVVLTPRDVRPAKSYLVPGDDVERAPSIGAKTARRLNNVGVTTVQDFLEEDADQLATMLGHRSLTGRLLREWQHQARLVMAVPGLRGTHAQLLVGAGFKDAAAIADADADQLCAAVITYATSREGQSILRDGDAPDIAKIKGWIEFAEQAVAA